MLIDIAKMPGYNPVVKNGATSVSDYKVSYGFIFSGEKLYPRCNKHGAMNCMAVHDAGKIWRCINCNEGAFEPREVG